MLIDQYYSEQEGCISFSRQQASDFAKQAADDFNPIHDIDAKRFCVPGDLLFSIILAKFGLNSHMQFTFSGMVTEAVELQLPSAASQLQLCDDKGKQYLNVERNENNSDNSALINSLTKAYVTFSGHTFPHILVPLLAEQQVMINPDRPMVIYQSMLIDLDTLDIHSPSLELNRDQTRLDVNGKRGSIKLAFELTDAGKIIGRGEKHMLVSGLKEYDAEVVEALAQMYAERKTAYKR